VATEDAAQEACRVVFGAGFPVAQRYADLLCREGIEWGLLGPREADRIWSRHLLNCASLASLVPSEASVVDVGSGAGLPGIPLAIARPDLSVVLLDSLLRRCRFLEMAVDELGLGDRVRVVRGRAEEQRELRVDVVVCRAVAPLERLVGWCVPLWGADGQLLALKGEGAAEEVAQAREVLTRKGLSAEVVVVDVGLPGDEATVVRVRQSPVTH